jgi:hypothetical protein
MTLAGCGGGETTTGTSTTTGAGGHGGAASSTTGTLSTGGSSAMGTGGTSPNPGGATFGQSCAKNGDCASLLCVDTDGTHAVCTRPCANDDACPPAPEWSCASKAGAAKVCLCQPSGEEICDGQDNDCDGVVDGKDCPEPVTTLMNTIADLKLSGDKLFYVTDKTIEKLDTAGGDPVVLRKDLVGIASLDVTATAIYWVEGKLRQMDFLGNAGPELAVASAPPVTFTTVKDNYSFYADTTGIHRNMAGINKLWVSGAISDMLVAKDVIYWFAGDKIYYVSAIGVTSAGTATLVTGQQAPVLLAATADAVYWASASAAIRKATFPAYTISDVITGEPGISAIAADTTNLYWATSDGVKSVLWKLPLSGGSKTKLGGVTGTARHLLPGGNYVYFETGKQIWRSPT